jgi:tetratricopeptide (TPR) repeat protein
MKLFFSVLLLCGIICQPASAVNAVSAAENHFHQGQVFAREKAYEKAQQAYLQALAVDPAYERAYIGLALIYSIRKEYPKALLQLDLVLKLNPKHPMAFKVKGQIFREQKKWSAAGEAFQTYLKLSKPEQITEKERLEIEGLISQLQKLATEGAP